MTKREPFAVVAIIDHVPVATFVEISGIYVGSYGGDDALQNANALADRLNAAFETAVAERVKEAVREAVEEFRDRAARRIERSDLYALAESGNPEDSPDFLSPAFSTLEWIANEVRKLPTEPEGK